MERYVNLAIAIVNAARMDYLSLNGDKSIEAANERRAIERFFTSETGQAITLNHGNEFIKSLKHARSEALSLR